LPRSSNESFMDDSSEQEFSDPNMRGCLGAGCLGVRAAYTFGVAYGLLVFEIIKAMIYLD
jgi:hypothetical protein